MHLLHLCLREVGFPALQSQHPIHGQWSWYADGMHLLYLRLREMDFPALHSLGGIGSVVYYLSITWSPRMSGRLRCLDKGKAVSWGGPLVS